MKTSLIRSFNIYVGTGYSGGGHFCRALPALAHDVPQQILLELNLGWWGCNTRCGYMIVPVCVYIMYAGDSWKMMYNR